MSEQPPLRGNREIRDEVVRLAELTVNNSTIEGYEFVNCRVIGPAVVALLGDVEIRHCTWDAPGLDAIFWEVPTHRELVVGVVGLRNCSFINCRLEQIGIAGPPEMRSAIESAFTSGQ